MDAYHLRPPWVEYHRIGKPRAQRVRRTLNGVLPDPVDFEDGGAWKERVGNERIKGDGRGDAGGAPVSGMLARGMRRRWPVSR